jgi:PKD repeat protein
MKNVLIILAVLLLLIVPATAGFTALPSLIDTPSLVNIQDGTQISSKDTTVKVSMDKQEFTANGITATAVPMIDGKAVNKSKVVSTKEGEALIFTDGTGYTSKYEYGGDYLKESITLTEPKKIEFTLTSTAMSSANLQDDGSIVIKGLLGNEAIYILRPFVIDAGGERTDIKYTLKDGVVGFNTDFKAFKYPIVIDPTFSGLPVYSPVFSSYSDFSFSNNSEYLAGSDYSNNRFRIFKHDYSNLSNWSLILNQDGLGILQLSFSPVDDYLIAATQNSPYVLIYAKNLSSTNNWTLLPNITVSAAQTSNTAGKQLLFSPTGNYVVVGSGTSGLYGVVLVKNLSSPSNWSVIKSSMTNYIQGAAFSPDENYMALVKYNSTSTTSQKIYIYAKNLSNTTNWTYLSPLTDVINTSPSSYLESVGFSFDSNYMFASGPVTGGLYLRVYQKNLSDVSNWTYIGSTSISNRYTRIYPINNNLVLFSRSGYIDSYVKNLSDSSNWSYYTNTSNTSFVGVSALSYDNLYYAGRDRVFNVSFNYPVSSFTTNTTSGTEPLSVAFTDSSTNTPISWLWQFGDGTANETTQNVTHTFTTHGTYQTNLTTTNADGSNLSSNTQITVTEAAPPVSNFTTNVTSGYPSFNVLFTDTSTNVPTSWLWQFGDGTANATTQNVTHTFDRWIGNTTTTYNVNLTATNADGSNKTSNVVITAYPLSHTFSSNTTSGKPPLYVQFNTTFANGTATAWNWSFGGTNYSSTRNATYTYMVAGTYDVILNSSNSYSYYWSKNSSMVTVNPLTPPVADFSANVTTGIVPKTIAFTDSSTNTPTTWLWQFGDGDTNTTQNPVHTYVTAGTYSVNLQAGNADGSDWENKTNYITLTAPPTPTPTPTPISGSSSQYFPKNLYTGIHMINATSIGVASGSMTGNVTNVSLDSVTWFNVGTSSGMYSYYTSTLTPNNVTGNFTFNKTGIPFLPGTKYYVRAACANGVSYEELNFTTGSIATNAITQTNYGQYFDNVQNNISDPTNAFNAVPLPIVDAFGGGSIGWGILFTVIFGTALVILWIRQENLLLTAMVAVLGSTVILYTVQADLVWIIFAAVAVIFGTAMYKVMRGNQS